MPGSYQYVSLLFLSIGCLLHSSFSYSYIAGMAEPGSLCHFCNLQLCFLLLICRLQRPPTPFLQPRQQTLTLLRLALPEQAYQM
jgi:hypothetical protein